MADVDQSDQKKTVLLVDDAPPSYMFLGLTEGTLERHNYFVRQLRDIKISIRVETFGAREMDLYATWCGRALALAHARAGGLDHIE